MYCQLFVVDVLHSVGFIRLSNEMLNAASPDYLVIYDFNPKH